MGVEKTWREIQMQYMRQRGRCDQSRRRSAGMLRRGYGTDLMERTK